MDTYIQPQDIYKYTDYKTARLIINNSSLRFTHPSNFNDPFDCDINRLHFDFSDACQEVKDDIAEVEKRMGRRIPESMLLNSYKHSQEEKLKRSSVSCFCLNNKNTLLWSYYADKHKGVCFGFDNFCDEKLVNIKESEFTEGIVNYKNLTANYCKDKWHGIRTLFATKSYDWRLEKEYRMILLKPSGNYVFNKKFLSSICFGINSKPNQRKEIINLAKSKGFKNLSFHLAGKDGISLKIDAII